MLVGTIDDAVVGYAVVRAERCATAARSAWSTTSTSSRRPASVGVGEAMMDARRRRGASDHGCVGIDASRCPGDRDTKNFFERFGLTAARIVVHRPLDA